MENKESKLYCSFCRKSEDEVQKLFSGRNAYVCNGCIKVAFNAKDDDETKKLIKHHLMKKNNDSYTP